MDHGRIRPASSTFFNQSSNYPAVGRSYLEQERCTPISIQTYAGTLEVRDAVSSDVNAYVAYWHHSGERIINLLGIDRRKLGTPEDTRQRFSSMIRIPGASQRNVIFTITLNTHVIGYTNLNQHRPNATYAHLHTYNSSIRSALKGAVLNQGAKASTGFAAALIGPIIDMYFDLYPLRRLVLQTRPGNRTINNALDLYMLPVERKYVENPAGLAAAGEQCLRYVYRYDLPRLLRHARLLVQPAGPRRTWNSRRASRDHDEVRGRRTTDGNREARPQAKPLRQRRTNERR